MVEVSYTNVSTFKKKKMQVYYVLTILNIYNVGFWISRKKRRGDDSAFILKKLFFSLQC